MLGFEKICHQPFDASAEAGRIEVMKRPRWTGARATQRKILAAVVSRGAGSSAAIAAMSDVPLEASDVQGEHRNNEQEEENSDRRAGAEVVRASEGGAPHRERNHVCIRLH